MSSYDFSEEAGSLRHSPASSVEELNVQVQRTPLQLLATHGPSSLKSLQHHGRASPSAGVSWYSTASMTGTAGSNPCTPADEYAGVNPYAAPSPPISAHLHRNSVPTALPLPSAEEEAWINSLAFSSDLGLSPRSKGFAIDYEAVQVSPPTANSRTSASQHHSQLQTDGHGLAELPQNKGQGMHHGITSPPYVFSQTGTANHNGRTAIVDHSSNGQHREHTLSPASSVSSSLPLPPSQAQQQAFDAVAYQRPGPGFALRPSSANTNNAMWDRALYGLDGASAQAFATMRAQQGPSQEWINLVHQQRQYEQYQHYRQVSNGGELPGMGLQSPTFAVGLVGGGGGVAVTMQQQQQQQHHQLQYAVLLQQQQRMMAQIGIRAQIQQYAKPASPYVVGDGMPYAQSRSPTSTPSLSEAMSPMASSWSPRGSGSLPPLMPTSSAGRSFHLHAPPMPPHLIDASLNGMGAAHQSHLHASASPRPHLDTPSPLPAPAPAPAPASGKAKTKAKPRAPARKKHARQPSVGSSSNGSSPMPPPPPYSVAMQDSVPSIHVQSPRSQIPLSVRISTMTKEQKKLFERACGSRWDAKTGEVVHASTSESDKLQAVQEEAIVEAFYDLVTCDELREHKRIPDELVERVLRMIPLPPAETAKGSRGGAAGHECLWAGCTTAIKRLDHSRNHVRGHCGSKPHVCGGGGAMGERGCQQGFLRMDDLKRHQREHCSVLKPGSGRRPSAQRGSRRHAGAHDTEEDEDDVQESENASLDSDDDAEYRPVRATHAAGTGSATSTTHELASRLRTRRMKKALVVVDEMSTEGEGDEDEGGRWLQTSHVRSRSESGEAEWSQK